MSSLRLFPVLLLGTLSLPGQDLKEFEKRVTEFTLDNGLHFILVERHDAPVVSLNLHVRAGSAQDPPGQSGLARLVSHFPYKGNESIGSKNWAEEKKAMDAADEAYDQMESEKNKGDKADVGIQSVAEARWKQMLVRAHAMVDPNEYARVVGENGGIDLATRASTDSTMFTCSMPSSRTELWFLLQSQWLAHPVFRDFYAERDAAVQATAENRALPALQQALLSLAFTVHPYRQPEIGWPSDLAHLRVAHAQAFVDKYYVPGNMVVTAVGDVNPAEMKRMAEKYFAPLRSRPLPPPLYTVEPPQMGPRTAVVGSSSQGLMLVGYKRPDQSDKDDSAFDLLQFILGGSQGGLLNKELVQGKAIAQLANAQSAFPNDRYPCLFVFGLSPQPNRTLEEVRKALDEILFRLMTRPLEDAALSRARAQLRSVALKRFDSNSDLSALLPQYYASRGDWRKMFEDITAVDKIKSNDVMRAAARIFTATNRSLVYSSQQGRPDTVQGLDGVIQ